MYFSLIILKHIIPSELVNPSIPLAPSALAEPTVPGVATETLEPELEPPIATSPRTKPSSSKKGKKK